MDALVAAALAPVCAVCDLVLDRPLDGAVCPRCWSAVGAITPPVCDGCGAPFASWSAPPTLCCDRCRQAPPTVARARALGEYAGALREVVHVLKYGGRRSVAAPLARLMRAAGSDLIEGIDACVPVPLHPWRSWQRGFNQADALARGLGMPVWPALRRRRPTRPQATLAAANRHANVAGAFAFARVPPWRPPWAQRVAGRTLLLVDDVRTTGATLDACAAVLTGAGAAQVRALTAARVSTGRA